MGTIFSCCTSDNVNPPFLPNRPEKKQSENNAETKFNQPYLFQTQTIIIIQHHACGVGSNGRNLLGNNVCVDDDKSCKKIFGNGEKCDEVSQFEAITEKTIFGDMIKLKSLWNGKYIRIVQLLKNHEPVRDLQCSGYGGKFCVFKVHHLSQNGYVKLESVEFSEAYIACDEDGTCVGNGGSDCHLELYQKQSHQKRN
eukprot:88455_1